VYVATRGLSLCCTVYLQIRRIQLGLICLIASGLIRCDSNHPASAIEGVKGASKESITRIASGWAGLEHAALVDPGHLYVTVLRSGERHRRCCCELSADGPVSGNAGSLFRSRASTGSAPHTLVCLRNCQFRRSLGDLVLSLAPQRLYVDSRSLDNGVIQFAVSAVWRNAGRVEPRGRTS